MRNTIKAARRVGLGFSAIVAFVLSMPGCSEPPPQSRVNSSGATGSGGSGTGSGTGSGGSAGTDAGGSGGTGTGSTGTSSGSGGTISLGGSSFGGSGGAPVGLETTCDGVDDDLNGIVDDVDVGKDGICDCLRIGTLGAPGPWGDGNIFATWLNARSAAGAVDLADQVITAEALGSLQVLVVQDVSEIGRTYAPAEVEALNAWVQAGGGLMTLIGYAEPQERENVNLLLGPTGISYGEQPILQKQGDATRPVTEWFAHATSEGVSSIGVDNGYPVIGAGTVVAHEADWDVARAVEVGAGKAFVWGDEWITYDTEWSDHPEYQVELLWLNIIKYLTPANECQVPIPSTVY